MKNKEKDYTKALSKAELMGQKSSEKDVKKIEKNLSFMKRGPVKKIWDKVEYLWNCFKM